MSLLISIPLILIGVVIQIFNMLSERYSDYIERIPYIRTLFFWLSIILILYGAYEATSSLLKEKKHEIFASPDEITLKHQRNKDLTLKVTNNQDIPLFDVHLGICVNNKIFDISSIKPVPVQKEKIPGVSVSMCQFVLNNGCSGTMFGSINAHSTREFNIRLDGEKISVDSKISFKVYNFSNEPHQISFPITEDHYKNLPQKFDDFFYNKKSESKKPYRAFAQPIIPPTNPYLPEEKELKIISIAVYKN